MHLDTHRIHGTGIFTCIKTHKHSPESFNGGIHEAAADSQPETSVDNVVASLEWLDEKMGTANLDLVPENLEKVCLETWEKGGG